MQIRVKNFIFVARGWYDRAWDVGDRFPCLRQLGSWLSVFVAHANQGQEFHICGTRAVWSSVRRGWSLSLFEAIRVKTFCVCSACKSGSRLSVFVAHANQGQDFPCFLRTKGRSMREMSWDRRRGRRTNQNKWRTKKYPHFILFSCRILL